MDLRVPIVITDERSEEVITSTGSLDLASGEIFKIEYQDWDTEAQGLPWEGEDYEFTSGTLSNNGRDVEFKVDINQVTGQYSVSATELLEVKVRAAQLFAGLSGKDLALRGVEPRPGMGPPAVKPAEKPTSKTPSKPAGKSRYH